MTKNKSASSRKTKLVRAATIAQSLPSRPKDAAAYICEAYAVWREQQACADEADCFAEYMGFFALLNMYLESLDLALEVPQLKGDKAKDMLCIDEFFNQVRHQLAQMTLDLSLLNQLNQSAEQEPHARFHQLQASETESLKQQFQRLQDWFDGTSLAAAAREALAEKYHIVQEQLQHDVLDLDLAWRYISQYSLFLDALETDIKPAIEMLQSCSGQLWRIQASAEKLPDSRLKNILLKLTNPTRWEQESLASRRES